MTDTPLVSIIIPCFNREEEIKDAIDSALAQTYKNIEIIVVDDGSTDNSIEVVESYSDGSVKLIKQPNKGVSAARNTGFAAANGVFTIFLDSDDWLSNDLVEKHIIASQKWPNVDIYCSDFKNFNDETGVEESLIKCNWPATPGTPLELFLLQPPPFPACELYRSETIRKHGVYDEDMRGFADSGLRLKIILAGGTVVRTEGGYAVYRRVANSITRNPLKLHFYAMKLIKKLLDNPNVQANPKIEELIHERLSRHRMRWWLNVLSHHARLNIISLFKFVYHLIKLQKVDPGYVLYLIQKKPWKSNKKEYI